MPRGAAGPRIRDNGVGIHPDTLTHGREDHFGLQGMRERAERIGGKLALSSSPSAGTEIRLQVPGSSIYSR